CVCASRWGSSERPPLRSCTRGSASSFTRSPGAAVLLNIRQRHGEAQLGALDDRREHVSRLLDVCELHQGRAAFLMLFLRHSDQLGLSLGNHLAGDRRGRTHDVYQLAHAPKALLLREPAQQWLELKPGYFGDGARLRALAAGDEYPIGRFRHPLFPFVHQVRAVGLLESCIALRGTSAWLPPSS